MRFDGKIQPTRSIDTSPGIKRSTSVRQVSAPPKTTPKPELFKSKSSPSILPSPTEHESLHDQIKSFDPNRLKKVSEHLPKPKGLQRALKKVQMETGRDVMNQKLGTTLRTETKEQFQRIDSSSMMEKVFRPHSKGLDTLIKETFSGEEDSLRSKLVSKSKVTHKAENKARQLMMHMDFDSELLLKIHTSSDDELRNEIAKSIGSMRTDRYGTEATYASLSSKKKSLVDHIVSGLREGATRRSGDLKFNIKDKVKNQMLKELSGITPESDKAFGWSLKSTDNIESEIALKMGWITQEKIDHVVLNASMDRAPEKISDWKFQLTQNQLDILESMSKGITEVLDSKIPNRAQSMTPLTYSDSGLQVTTDVPESFTLNGKEYDTPVYMAKGGLGLILEYSSKTNPDDKVIVKSLLDPFQREDMVKEMIAHRHILGGENLTPHDNIVTMRGAFKGPSDGIFMVMDKADGDMEQLTKLIGFTKSHSGVSEFSSGVLMQYYLKEAAEGLEYLQSTGSMHNDIKDKNFLFKEGKVLLSDFGSTHTKTVLEDTDSTPTTFGGFEWQGGHVTQKHDMYALGIFLHQLGGGSAPPLGEFLKSDPKDVTALGRLKTGLLSDDPKERLTPEGVLDSSFVKNLDTIPKHLVSDLVSAVETFNKMAGPDFHRMQKQIDNLEGDIQSLSKLLQFQPENQVYQNDLARLQQERDTLLLSQERLLEKPEVKSALEALQRASKALDNFTPS